MKAITLAPILLAYAATGEPIASYSLACNPAHSYPNGATCIETSGTLTLVAPTAATSCNLLDVGASCYATAGSITSTAPSYPPSSVPSSTSGSPISSTSSTSSVSSYPAHVCNPAYSNYNMSCISTSESPTLTASKSHTKESHTKGHHDHTRHTHNTGIPPLKTDTSAPPISSTSAAASTSASASASTSPSPASGDAAQITFGGITVLAALAGFLAL